VRRKLEKEAGPPLPPSVSPPPFSFFFLSPFSSLSLSAIGLGRCAEGRPLAARKVLNEGQCIGLAHSPAKQGTPAGFPFLSLGTESRGDMCAKAGSIFSPFLPFPSIGTEARCVRGRVTALHARRGRSRFTDLFFPLHPSSLLSFPSLSNVVASYSCRPIIQGICSKR